jgi:hypothetical protein
MIKYLKIPLIIIVILIAILGIKLLFSNDRTSASDKIDIASPKASVNLNKEFVFPIKDDKGNVVTKFKYNIDTAELRDEIIIQGQKSTAVKGRTFLIFNLKLVNDFDKPININSRDFIRLSVNGNTSELLAPDIHNDPVNIQATSTKYTRIGFPINENDNRMKLVVGEIGGHKDQLDLNLKY